MKLILSASVLFLVVILGLIYQVSPEKTVEVAAGFETTMKLVRPALIVTVFFAFLPIGLWLARTSRITNASYLALRKVWAPALIWYVVLEVGIGQGKPIVAVVLALVYGAARLVLPSIIAPRSSLENQPQENQT